MRDGWVFQPKSCVYDTFSYEDLMLLAERKKTTWILVLGGSVQRGVFLTLVDMALAQGQKDNFTSSAVGKCWGYADIQIGNLRMTYQASGIDTWTVRPRGTQHSYWLDAYVDLTWSQYSLLAFRFLHELLLVDFHKGLKSLYALHRGLCPELSSISFACYTRMKWSADLTQYSGIYPALAPCCTEEIGRVFERSGKYVDARQLCAVLDLEIYFHLTCIFTPRSSYAKGGENIVFIGKSTIAVDRGVCLLETRL